MKSMSPRNQLLLSLRADDLTRLKPALQPIDLPVRTVLEEAGVPIEFVYFMESGFASVVTGSRVQIEIGLIGREGMSGLSVVMGDDRSVNQTFMQADGSALRMTADDLREALHDSPTLHSNLLRYAQAFAVQTSQTALVNGRATLERRLARWLLMAHDRFDHNDFPVTHQFIALMLGVRRAGVTNALHILEGEHLLKARRGQITIVDRKGLEALSTRPTACPRPNMCGWS
jgi:CRP-like cAMP-binding protein